jgi:hypothetical protein
MKSGNLNFLEPSGPLQACNGTDFIIIIIIIIIIINIVTQAVLNTLKTGGADLRFYITTVQDG